MLIDSGQGRKEKGVLAVWNLCKKQSRLMKINETMISAVVIWEWQWFIFISSSKQKRWYQDVSQMIQNEALQTIFMSLIS